MLKWLSAMALQGSTGVPPLHNAALLESKLGIGTLIFACCEHEGLFEPGFVQHLQWSHLAVHASGFVVLHDVL